MGSGASAAIAAATRASTDDELCEVFSTCSAVAQRKILRTMESLENPQLVNFAIEPLSVLAAKFDSLAAFEEVTLLAVCLGVDSPYALQMKLPLPGDAQRSRGLDLLFARAVTITAAIVGTSSLRLVCEHEETFQRLVDEFDNNTAVVNHLQQYGPFALTRAGKEDIPAELKMLPFISSSSQSKGLRGNADIYVDTSKSSCRSLYVGVDFGRSDVKVAVIGEADDATVFATYVTRWWRMSPDTCEREYLDPAKLSSIQDVLKCLGEAALDAILSHKFSEDDPQVLRGLGLSAAGCVRNGVLCGVPPAFAGCQVNETMQGVLQSLELAILNYVRENVGRLPGLTICDRCATVLVNDGDASALDGEAWLQNFKIDNAVGVFLSCGTGLAGGILSMERGRCGGVLEMGKVIVGLRSVGSGVSPKHDTLGVYGVAQGMAGTQRSFFNLLEARGGDAIQGKAEQRAAIVAMQKRPLDDEVRDIFGTLGEWLAQFIIELSVYLPLKISHVMAGGKLTDAECGEVMMTRARDVLGSHGIQYVQRAHESEFGQAIAVARAVCSSVTD